MWFGVLAVAACSTTKALPEGEYLLRSAKVVLDRKEFPSSNLNSYISQRPNSYILGVNPLLYVYNWGGVKDTWGGRFFRSIGVEPVVFDPVGVEKSISNLENHLKYIGFYGSSVTSSVNYKKRKAYVTYYVHLGKRYQISSVDYQIPSYGSFRQDFDADRPNIGIKPGMFLSESALEAEAERSSAYMRTKGYYGFNKSFYAFEADTLSHDGNAKVKVEIRDYALGDAPSSAAEHKKFTLGEVNISHPQRLKIRRSVLENLNTLRPGMLYNEQEINTTYNRLSSVNMLSGVSINTTPVADDKVNCDISLRNSGLQAFKAQLEASVNSTGLMGISPQLNYSHKNIFHGGEVLNLGLKGNFQFKPGDNAYSTEVSVTGTIRFPKFLGIPSRVFKGPNVPRTDLNLAFHYQDRPEYKRTVISTALTYNGRIGKSIFYQLTPVRANITRIFNIDEDFWDKIVENLYMVAAYNNNFDLGVSGMLYYTTDSSPIPMSSYHYARLNLDVSGNLLSAFNKLMPTDESGSHLIWNIPYARYVRVELNLGKTFRFGRNERQALALRLLGGVGYSYGNSYSMPLERMFTAGGSASMRGWQARTLGPGNDTLYAELFSIPSQVGDMKLEANIEYRFPLFWKLEGAAFVDAGNIWDVTSSSEESLFSFKNLPQSTGLDWGLGIRLNLSYILVRLDAGVRLHDPGRAAGDRWVPVNQWFKGNTAIHFGVGYPF